MARDFNGSTGYLSVGSTPITAAPFSVSCWVQRDGTSPDAEMYSVMIGATSNYGSLTLGVYDSGGGTYTSIFSAYQESGDAYGASEAAVIATGSWYHLAGTSSAANNRICYVNGSAGSTNTTSVTPASQNQLTIGALWVGGDPAYAFWNGKIADVAIWNVALSASEIEALAQGLCPLFVRPTSLVFYVPILGNSPEGDWTTGGRNMTVNGTAPFFSHPPQIVYPRQAGRIILPAAGATDYPLDLGSGSFSLSGVGLSPLADRLLLLNTGSIVLTGIDLSTLADRLLTLAPDSFTLTGVDLTTQRGRLLVLDTGTYTLTGVDLSTIADRILVLDTGSYTLTGIDLTILADRVLSLSPGTYTLTGIDISFLVTASGTHSLDLLPGTFIITGDDMSFVYVPVSSAGQLGDRGLFLGRKLGF